MPIPKTGAFAAVVAMTITGPSFAQTSVPGDPHASDPVGIVAAPCPAHPAPATPQEWQMWNLHMLTRDHGQLCRYRVQNAALHEPVRVVFMGDSITDNWIGADPSMFRDSRIDRGISGQTTAQMLLRFRQDVIALHPKAVHIMAGTNDIAGNTGAATIEIVQGHIETMAELARAHGIKVILASIPAAAAFPWSPAVRPAPQIVTFNIWLRGYAQGARLHLCRLSRGDGDADRRHEGRAGDRWRPPHTRRLRRDATARPGRDRKDAGSFMMTSIDRRTLLAGATALGLGQAAAGATAAPPTSDGRAALRAVAVPAPSRFTADWASLTAGYTAPDWFRDAKFGIWAHWGAPSVPAAGDDWYARDMYLQGHPSYDHHLKRYGHPADRGFMEIQNAWKAERWNPAELLDLYKHVGARYFMALANHHDNLDCYASSHHPWNSMRVGPKKDIVGTWATLVRERGLRFAVSNHSGHAWHWNQPAYGYDPEGPRRGQRYDAARLSRSDGRGRWWDGLDPQQLYGGPTMQMPDGLGSIAEANAWHAATDGLWDEGPSPDPVFVNRWLLRCRELIDRYQPDMLYFDNHDLPLGQAGLDIAAYFYNQNMRRNGGRLDVVCTAKETRPQRRMGLVDVVERGQKAYIDTYPWQTETCLGNWFYGEQYLREDRYKTPAKVLHTLCDVVSKNGNMMLSVPIRGDGTIDAKEREIVEAIGVWMRRYGDAIYATRPWRVHGEGPTGSGGGSFSEGGRDSGYTARDIRYVRKGEALHALVLGWPEDGTVRLTSLGTANPVGRGQISRVALPSGAALPFRRTAEALEVQMPAAERNAIGLALIIQGRSLTDG